MVLDLRLTLADWMALQQVLLHAVRLRIGRLRHLVATMSALVFGAALAGWVAGTTGAGPAALLCFAVGMLAYYAVTVWWSREWRRHMLPDADGAVLGSLRMELVPEGIRTVRRTATALTPWPAVRAVTRTDTHVFLWIDRVAAYIVPLRDVPQGAEALLETIRGLAGSLPHTDPAGSYPAAVRRDSVSAPIPAGGAPSAGLARALVRRLTWRAVRPEERSLADSDAVILTCAGAALAVWLAYDRHAMGPKATWYPGAAAGLAWYALGALAFAWVLHRAALKRAPLRALLAAVVAGLPVLLAAGVALRLWAPAGLVVPGQAALTLVALWYLKRSLNQAGVRSPGPLLAGSVFALLFYAATAAAWVYPHAWYAGADDDQGASWGESERMLFTQAERIDEAAAHMAPARAHRPDVFFVGFAGVAEQKVFAEEIALSERVVAERYGSAGRSLLLVNDRRDRQRWPIATVSGLRRALARVAARMNLEEDVLFLVLTSHGSAKPELSVSNGNWPLEQLDGRALRAALDEAGIRWRAVVISACHAGAFIEPLADERTIVLAAAAKERTSFGCDDAADLTHFGQALMREALPKAESLEEAFEEAKRRVGERESREHLEASDPQAYYGSEIREYWKQVETARPRVHHAGT